MKVSSKFFFHVKALSRKTYEAFIFYVSLILLVKKTMDGHVIYLDEPNTFKTYQNLKKLYAMKII